MQFTPAIDADNRFDSPAIDSLRHVPPSTCASRVRAAHFDCKKTWQIELRALTRRLIGWAAQLLVGTGSATKLSRSAGVITRMSPAIAA